MEENKKKFLVSNCFWPKREFNPASAEDLKIYQNFVTESKWAKGCPFIVEWPYLNVVDTIKQKIINYHLARLIAIAEK